MACSVTFVIKEPKSAEASLIYLVLRFGSYRVEINNDKKLYQQLKFSTGIKWKPQSWNAKKHKGRDGRDHPDPTELNQRLSNMETVILDIYRKLVNDGTPITSINIRSEIDKRTDVFPDLKRKAVKQEARKEQPRSLIGFFEEYVKNTKFIYRKGLPYPINSRTQQRYATTLRHLKNFARTVSYNVDFDTIDLNFYTDFVHYLRTQVEKKSKNQDTEEPVIIKMAENTVGKHISTLKTVLNAARLAGINSNLRYTDSKFASISEDIEKIYLTEMELQRIYKLDLTDIKYLERVRDLFLIGCYTCLRFSDFTNLRRDNIYKNDKGIFIKIITQKTGDIVVLPLHRIVSEILVKYAYDLPRSISNQKMNDYLKQIGKKAEIEDQVNISKIEGGIKAYKSFKKYELISTHTARRSGATNMYLAGIPAISIMKITGHKTESAFMRYIQMSQEDNANKLMDHPFFRTINN